MKKEIIEMYNKIESFKRYTPDNDVRWLKLKEEYAKIKKYTGKNVLDLACGGGILGFLMEADNKKYTGVDINPNMIKAAKKYAVESKSKCIFIEADSTKHKINGKFDSFVIIGNSLSHINFSGFEKLMKNTEKNSKKGSTFIVDYRDTVKKFYDGTWLKKFKQEREGKKVITEDTCVDTEKGIVLNQAGTEGRKKIKSTQAIWSPFILEPLMKAYGWKRIHREPCAEWSGWLDVYIKN